MECTIAYGKKTLTFDVPEHVRVDTYAPAAVERPVGFEGFWQEYLASGARRFLSEGELLFIVNDAYRHTPTVQVLRWLETVVDRLWVRSRFLIATGAHRAPTELQMRSIFGPYLERVRDRVNVHDATDKSSMTKVGTDCLGEDVYLNSAVLAHDKIVAIGSVEPHYFAGYTGGRKAFFPGVCDIATTERNHNMANQLEAQPLRLAGNPVAEHLQSLMSFLDGRNIFSVQLVADSDNRIAGVFLGSLENSFTRAVTRAERLYAHQIEEPYDAVVCEILPPLDANMYQAQKALENNQLAVKDGGTAIVVSAAEEGAGSEFYIKEAEGWDPATNRPKDGKLRFGSHKLTRMVLHQRRIDVRLKSTVLDKLVEKVFYRPANDVTKLLREKLSVRDARLAIVRDAAHTVLRIKQPQS